MAAFSPDVEAERKQIKDFLYENLYYSPSLAGEKDDAERIVTELFDFWMKNPSALPHYLSGERRTGIPAARSLRLHRRHDRSFHHRAVREAFKRNQTFTTGVTEEHAVNQRLLGISLRPLRCLGVLCGQSLGQPIAPRKLLLPCHGCHHIKQNPRPSPHFFHADAFIVSVFGVAFFVSRSERIEPVRIDAQRPVTLVLGVPAGDVRHHRRTREIGRRDFANRVIQSCIRWRKIGLAKFRDSSVPP